MEMQRTLPLNLYADAVANLRILVHPVDLLRLVDLAVDVLLN
jgi:hypothetical protein